MSSSLIWLVRESRCDHRETIPRFDKNLEMMITKEEFPLLEKTNGMRNGGTKERGR